MKFGISFEIAAIITISFNASFRTRAAIANKCKQRASNASKPSLWCDYREGGKGRYGHNGGGGAFSVAPTNLHATIYFYTASPQLWAQTKHSKNVLPGRGLRVLNLSPSNPCPKLVVPILSESKSCPDKHRRRRNIATVKSVLVSGELDDLLPLQDNLTVIYMLVGRIFSDWRLIDKPGRGLDLALFPNFSACRTLFLYIWQTVRPSFLGFTSSWYDMIPMARYS